MVRISGSSDRATVELQPGDDRELDQLGLSMSLARATCFVEATGIPFLPMSTARGLLPDDHPQSVAVARSMALAGADGSANEKESNRPSRPSVGGSWSLRGS